jgi:signal transduction histidine kinase
MERLVKNLLNLSALEILADVEKEPVDLHRLLSSLLQDYILLAEAGKIEIQTELAGNLIVAGQSDKLERLFSNLLDNAIKYNRHEGWVRVAGAQTGEETKIVISNSGPGLAAAEIAKVFAPFYRAEESRAALYGGSGLGLAIVKRIIELHDGEVAIESQPGEWTRVTVILRNGRGESFVQL